MIEAIRNMNPLVGLILGLAMSYVIFRIVAPWVKKVAKAKSEKLE